MKYLYQQITIHWSSFSDEGEKNILRTCAYHGRLLTLGYTGKENKSSLYADQKARQVDYLY